LLSSYHTDVPGDAHDQRLSQHSSVRVERVATKDNLLQPRTTCCNQGQPVATKDNLLQQRTTLMQQRTTCGNTTQHVATTGGFGSAHLCAWRQSNEPGTSRGSNTARREKESTVSYHFQFHLWELSTRMQQVPPHYCVQHSTTWCNRVQHAAAPPLSRFPSPAPTLASDAASPMRVRMERVRIEHASHPALLAANPACTRAQWQLYRGTARHFGRVAHGAHICSGTGLTPATSAPGLHGISGRAAHGSRR
jgi:hypothetical protein